jgi:molybdate transport system ATP-binding protein
VEAEMKNNWMVHLERVTVRVRDRRLLSDTDWVIDSDQHWAVIGPNGAGKTSLVAALAGEIPIVAGKIHFNPQYLMSDQIGYVSFEHHRRLIAREDLRDHARFFSRNFDYQTVRDVLRRPIGGHGPNRSAWNALPTHLALEHLLDRPVRHLSDGEIRQVLIAREMVRSPRLLILDEPFDGLDPTACRNLQDWFEQHLATGPRLVLVTHRLHQIPAFVTHVLAVRGGRVRYQAARNEALALQRLRALYAQPAADPDQTMPENGKNGRDSPSRAGDLIIFKNVTVAFGGTLLLQHLNWTMKAGENWSILGPNGSGKSTLLRLIVGDMTQAYANHIYLFGQRRGSGESVWEIKHRIGYVSPEFQIRYRKPISAMAVVLSGYFDSVGLYRAATLAQRQNAQRWLRQMGMGHLARRDFTTLSQGEQRRVLLARAMVKEPLLLVLDEPCQGLDPNAWKMTMQLIDRIGRRPGTNILHAGHHDRDVPACITHVLRFIPTPDGSYRYARQSARDAFK